MWKVPIICFTILMESENFNSDLRIILSGKWIIAMVNYQLNSSALSDLMYNKI